MDEEGRDTGGDRQQGGTANPSTSGNPNRMPGKLSAEGTYGPTGTTSRKRRSARPHWRLTLGDESTRLKDKINSVLQEGVHDILLNLGGRVLHR